MSVAPGSLLARVATALALLAALLAPAAAADQRPSDLVWVATAGDGPVSAYTGTSHGRVSAVLEADNPENPNVEWDPWGAAFDRRGNLYVQSFLGDATTFVFARLPHRGDRPIRIFSAYRAMPPIVRPLIAGRQPRTMAEHGAVTCGGGRSGSLVG